MQKVAKMNEAGRLVGESHPLAKLTDAEIDLVLELLAGGMSLRKVADKFGVSKSCIQHIASGRNRSQIVAKAVRVSVNP